MQTQATHVPSTRKLKLPRSQEPPTTAFAPDQHLKCVIASLPVGRRPEASTIVPRHDEGRRAAAETVFEMAQKVLISSGVMTNEGTLLRDSLSIFIRGGVLQAMYVGIVCLPHISLMPRCCLPKVVTLRWYNVLKRSLERGTGRPMRAQ